MKILLVSDLHYALKQFDWTAAVAPNFDLVVIAGDHLDIAGHIAGNVQILVVLKYLRRLASHAKVIASSGNHDLDERDDTGEKVASWMRKVRQLGVPTDGDSVEMGDTLITVCPWWDGPASRKAVEAQIARDADREKARWIWVYHAPPEGPTSWNGKRSFGDEALTEWISAYGPDYVFTGHIHEAPFKQGGSWIDQIGRTWIFNCGRQIGATPTHVMIDTELQEAAWFSLAGAELARLGEPLVRPVAELTAAQAWLALSSPVRGQTPV